MKMNLLMILGFSLLSACTAQQAYEGLRFSEQNNCLNLPPSLYKDCMARTQQPYEDYKRDRDAVIQPDAQ